MGRRENLRCRRNARAPLATWRRCVRALTPPLQTVSWPIAISHSCPTRRAAAQSPNASPPPPTVPTLLRSLPRAIPPDVFRRGTRRSRASPRRQPHRRAGKARARSAIRGECVWTCRARRGRVAAPGRRCRAPSSASRRVTTTSSSSCCRCRAYTCERPAGRGPVRCLQGNGLPRVHDIERIECTLDRAHEIDGLAVFLRQHVELVPADPVLARARAAHGDRAQRHCLGEALCPLALAGVIRVEEHD